jgi:UDP-glucose 4-epimerase
MKILVTGGAGFIGSHLADRLIADGHGLTVLDNEVTGRPEHVPSAARYIKGDVSRPEDVEAVFRDGVDAVCHIAGQVSLIRSFADPVADLRTNVEGVVNILQSCIRHRVPRLLYASSMTVYGANPPLPTPEVTPCAPISYYGITKYAGERYAITTGARRDLGFTFHVTCFRMYNVYGPRQAIDNPYQGVLGIFLGNVLRGEEITIFGDGDQSRDFIYIADVVDAWAGSLANPATYGQIFNLGSGRRLAINCLADHVLACLGRTRTSHPVSYAPARPGEQRDVEADITRARAALGWEPRVPFEDGLAETVRWAERAAATDGHQSSGSIWPIF